MTPDEQRAILAWLDGERQTVIYPGVTRVVEGSVVKDIADDGQSAEIVYSAYAESDIDATIAAQIHAAQDAGYELEWKWYGHDRPPNLGERLMAAGFQAGDREAFLVVPATAESVAPFSDSPHDVRRVADRDGLRDYQTIWEEVSGKDRASDMERYAAVLETHPDTLSVYVAYVNGEPAACGRSYFHKGSQFAGLYGGSTRAKFRHRGLFTAVVGARLREAVQRRVAYVTVDALPTSEPILTKRGFQFVTATRPYCFSPK